MVAIGLVLDGDSTCRRRLVVSPSWSYEYLLQRISSLFHDLEIEKIRDLSGNQVLSTEDIVENDLLVVTPKGFHSRASSVAFANAIYKKVPHSEIVKQMQVLRNARSTDFELDHMISAGQSGPVFAVRCSASSIPKKNQLFSLKISVPFTDNSDQSFLREYDVLTTILPHRNVLQAWALLRDTIPEFANEYIPQHYKVQMEQSSPDIQANVPQIVTDYHPTTLEVRAQEFPANIPELDVLRYAEDLLSAITHLAEQNVVHRDVKLNNILVGQDDRLVLCDFGSAIVCPESDLKRKYSRGQSPGGNVKHLAPEVVTEVNKAEEGNDEVVVDFSKQDVWAVGVVLYELILGTHPLEDYPHAFEVNDQVVYTAKDLPPLPATYNERFKRVLMWMLEADPEKRLSPSAALGKVQCLLLGDGSRVRLSKYIQDHAMPADLEEDQTMEQESKEDQGTWRDIPVKNSVGVKALVRIREDSTVFELINDAVDVLNITDPIETCGLLINGVRKDNSARIKDLKLDDVSFVYIIGGLEPLVDHTPQGPKHAPAPVTAVPKASVPNPGTFATTHQPIKPEEVDETTIIAHPPELIREHGEAGADGQIIHTIPAEQFRGGTTESDDQATVRLLPQSVKQFEGTNLTGAGYVFNPVLTNGAVRFNHDFTVAEHDGKWSSISVMMNPITEGKCLFAVKLLSADSGCGFAVGMACAPRENFSTVGARGREGFNPRTHSLGAHPDSFAYSKTGKKGNGGGFHSYGSAMVTGDIIQVETDMDNGTIRFYRNGVDQGVAFDSGIKGEKLFPVVCLGSNKGGKLTRVQLVNPEPMSFDRTRSHSRMQCGTSHNPRGVKNERKWATALCSHNGIVSGQATFSIKLSAVQSGGGVAVGVVDAEKFNPKTSNLGASEYSWGFSKTGKRGDGSGFKDYGCAFTNGDVVTVHVDADVGTIGFDVNGIYQGVAYGPGSPDFNPEENNQIILKGRCLIPAVCLGSSEGDKSCLVELTDEDRHYRVPRFDPLRCRPTTQLSEFCRLAETRGKWGTVFVNMKPVTRGVATVGFEVVSAEAGCGAAVGCADASVFKPAISNLGASANSWAYSKTGKASKGTKFSSFGDSYKTGDIVTLDIDMQYEMIDFYKNGVFQGTLEKGGLGDRSLIPGICIGNSEGGLYTALRLVPPAVIRFDDGRKSSHISLQDGGRIAETTSKWASVFALHPGQHSGVMRFAVKLLGQGGAAVGVADVNNFKPQYQNVGAAPYSWALSKSGKIASGEGWRAYTDKLESNDIIGVEMDFNNGNLSFYRNGNCLGVAFSNLEGRGYIMVPSVCIGSNLGERQSTAVIVPMKTSTTFPAPSNVEA